MFFRFQAFCKTAPWPFFHWNLQGFLNEELVFKESSTVFWSTSLCFHKELQFFAEDLIDFQWRPRFFCRPRSFFIDNSFFFRQSKLFFNESLGFVDFKHFVRRCCGRFFIGIYNGIGF